MMVARRTPRAPAVTQGDPVSLRTLGRSLAGLLLAGLAGLALALGAEPLWAQESVAAFPTKAIRVVIGYPPGSGADLIPRMVGERLQQKWGHGFVVDNRPGASGHIASEIVFKAPPDGYTLLVVPAAFATTPHMFASLPFDPDAFVPVTVMASQANVLLVQPARLPDVRSLMDLIALARANPDKLYYGSTGNGGSSHLSTELFKILAGNLRITHVPYKGVAVLNAMLSNEIDFAVITLGAALPHIKAGKLRPLAVGGDRRYPGLPDVPTMHEVVPGLVSTAWFALLAPPRTSAELVAKINGAVVEALRHPDTQKKLADLTADTIANSPAEAATFIAEEKARWGKVIRAANVKAD